MRVLSPSRIDEVASVLFFGVGRAGRGGGCGLARSDATEAALIGGLDRDAGPKVLDAGQMMMKLMAKQRE